MASITERGKRLLPATLDSISLTEPHRPWISVPLSDGDLSKGYTNITFGQFANAVNHAAAWLKSAIGKVGQFEVFAYEGPPDARLAIITVAAAKIGWKVCYKLTYRLQIPDTKEHQILLPFPYATPQVKGFLLDKTKCRAFIYASPSISTQRILDERPHIAGIVAPSLQAWITAEPAVPYDFNKS